MKRVKTKFSTVQRLVLYSTTVFFEPLIPSIPQVFQKPLQCFRAWDIPVKNKGDKMVALMGPKIKLRQKIHKSNAHIWG